jgi:hypothetical protein
VNILTDTHVLAEDVNKNRLPSPIESKQITDIIEVDESEHNFGSKHTAR